MNYSELSDFEINKLVANHWLPCDYDFNEDENRVDLVSLQDVMNCGMHDQVYKAYSEYNPCNNPSDAWPIIFENEMSIWPVYKPDYEIGMSYSTGEWKAFCVKSIDGESCVDSDGFEASDENPLRAAMIAYLMMQDK